jgi:hypothetical protein
VILNATSSSIRVKAGGGQATLGSLLACMRFILLRCVSFLSLNSGTGNLATVSIQALNTRPAQRQDRLWRVAMQLVEKVEFKDFGLLSSCANSAIAR